MVVFQMIDHLSGIQIRYGRCCILIRMPTTHRSVEASHIITNPIAISFMLLGAKAVISDAVGDGLPLEVEHGVDWLDFNPPASTFKGFSYKAAVVSRSNDELVTVFDISIFKGYF